MKTLDILICTLNARIVRIPDMLMAPTERVRYVVSFQYTDEKYLSMMPKSLKEREDVTVVQLQGEGLSANRNNALKYATSDLVYLVDDDARFLPDSLATIFSVFESYSEGVDIALFKAQTYAGRDLREYTSEEGPCTTFADLLPVLTMEMVCRRDRVQGFLSFDSRFGLGAEQLTCYEEQIFLDDARRQGLNICYFALPIVQTSALYVPRMIYVDSKVQRSYGALLYHFYGWRAYVRAFFFALSGKRKRLCHFLPVFKRQLEGIAYIKSFKDK